MIRLSLLLMLPCASLCAATPPTGKAVIEGTVLNGITHQPIKRAQVNLGGNGMFLTVVTDPTGRFIFKDLPAGQFALQASAPNFSPFRSDPRSPAHRQIKLNDDSKRNDLNLSLFPDASIAGHVFDEDGASISNCAIFLLSYDPQTNIGNLLTYGAQTNDAGEFLFANVPPGTYRMTARCQSEKPLPHAFIERGSDTDVPSVSYAPQYYPGASDVNGAAAIVASPGVETTGLDFHMSSLTGLTVRGRFQPTTEALKRAVGIRLAARDPVRRDLFRYQARIDKTDQFTFRNVAPGSYYLIAETYFESPFYYSSVSVDIGAEGVEPLELTIMPVAPLPGAVVLDDSSQKLPANVRVRLIPVFQNRNIVQPVLVQKDGTFVLQDIVPGKWRLRIEGAPAYVKSAFLNEQEVSPSHIEVPQGTAGRLRIVIETKWSHVEGNVSSTATGTDTITAIMWPVDHEFTRLPPHVIMLDPQNQFKLDNVEPGRYYACAFSALDPWSVINDRTILNRIESQCKSFDATPGEKTTIELKVITEL